MKTRVNDPFLSFVVENISEGLCVCHNIDEFPYVRFTVWNKRMYDLTGYTMDEINKSGWYQTVYPDPDLQEMAINRMNEMRQGDNLRDERWEITRSDGQKRWLSISTTIVGDENNMTHVMALMRDSTERKQAEKKLTDSEVTLKIIFNSTSDGILVADVATQTFLTGNKAICRMLGYTLEELTGLGVDDIHPPESLPEMHRQFAKLTRKEIKVSHDLPVLKKNGSVFLADISAAPTIISGREYLIGLFRDVTENRKLEEQLRQSQKMEAVGTMAGGIAHDFNNILTIILGNAEMAIDDLPPGNPTRESIEEIMKASQRAKTLVRQILAFSRKEKKELIAIRPQPLIKETLKLLRSITPATITIVEDISQDCGVIKVDPTQLHQLLMNLFTNAVHAMDEKGDLTVSLQEMLLTRADFNQFPIIRPQSTKIPRLYARLSVIDSGCGMDKEIIDRIFDPFYTTKDVGKGTGMGLSVVHGIVESHGGFIVVDSEPGQGSTFQVFFPITDEEEYIGTGTSTLPRRGTEHVLVIEDEDSLLELAKRMLESLDYRVTTESSGIKALERFKADPYKFDLIFTDQAMPNMSGSELIAEIVRIRPDMPIILCTGFSTKITAENAREKGVSKYLNKPYNKKILSETVRDVLDGNV